MESCLRANNIDPGSARSIFETIRCVVAQWNSKRVSSSDQSMEKEAEKKRRSKKDVVEESQQVVPAETSEPHTTKVSVVKNEPVQIEPNQDMSMDVEECCKTTKKKRAQAAAAPSDSGSGKRRKTDKSKSPSPDSVEPPPANAKKASKRKEDRKEDGNVVESVAGPSGISSVAPQAAASVAAPPPVPPALPSRKLVLNKVQEGILADFEIIDPRRITADDSSSSKKKKFASTSFLTLALRMLVDKSLLTNEGLLLKSNVFVKPNVLSGFSIHVYGADGQTRVVYSGSLFDSAREGFSVYVHNLGPSRQINAGEVIAFLEIRSDDDRLKISY